MMENMSSVNLCLLEKQGHIKTKSKGRAQNRDSSQIPWWHWISPDTWSERRKTSYQKTKKKRHSFFKSSTSLSGCHSPCLTLSITMSQSSQVSLGSASWCWMDICQLYSSEYFDVARCDLAHYHTWHESILCINILIIRFILITCTLAFAGLLHAPCLI